MQDFLESIEGSLEGGYIYPAFISCLCLPDICSYIDNPQEKSVGRRYQKWFESYMPSNYFKYISSEEAYALRCIVLHNGELSLTQYKKQPKKSNVILDKFELFQDGIHLLRATENYVNDTVQPNLTRLNARQYCQDIIDSVRKWEESTGKNLGEYDEVFAIKKGGDMFIL